MLENLMFSGRYLFLLYIALSFNYLTPLIPCSTTRLINDSMAVRHLIAFVAIVFLSVLSDSDFGDFKDIIPILVSCVFVYAWFMISAKMTANWWIPLVLLLAGLYILNMYREHVTVLTKDLEHYLDYAEYAGIALSALITFFGFIIYVGEKKIDYRGKFDYTTLILGTATCKNTPSKVSYVDSLKAAFMVPPGSAAMRGGFMSEDSMDAIKPISSFDYVSAE